MCMFAPQDFPEVDDGSCCYGAMVDGPGHCTCWRPEYDLTQVDPDLLSAQLLAAGIQPVTRDLMCADCAYRPGSPEKSGAKDHAGDPDQLDDIAASSRFWCHQGIRRPARWRHPSGAVIDGHPAAYDPPIVAGVPYRADGTPAELCAGWAARRRAIDAAVAECAS